MTMPQTFSENTSIPENNEDIIRITAPAVKELEDLFSDEETRHVRIIATPG